MRRRGFLKGFLAAIAAPAVAAKAVLDVVQTSKPIRRLRWQIVQEAPIEHWADPKAEQLLIDALAEQIRKDIEGYPNTKFTRAYAETKIKETFYKRVTITA